MDLSTVNRTVSGICMAGMIEIHHKFDFYNENVINFLIFTGQA